MKNLEIDGDWHHICSFFPSDLDSLAKETGAVVRWRNVKSGEDLLRLALTYVVENFSLRSTAAFVTRSKLMGMKDTSVLHRLKKMAPFLESVLAHLLNFRVKGEPAKGPKFLLNDATVISIPGSTGTDWRIHAVYDPQSARLARVQVTDYRKGESLTRDEYSEGEVIMADRGLAHAKGIHAVTQAGAYVLLRMHWQNIRLEDEQGNKPDLEDILNRAENGDAETEINVPLKGKESVPARLIVRPLPKDEAEKARRKLRRTAAKKGRKPSKLGLLLAAYFCLITTLPHESASSDVLLELYRIRWQIELFFKRCKSLLQLDELRADDPDLVKAYCISKLIEVVLIELLAEEGELFSPWGTPRMRYAAGEPVAASPYF